MADGRTNPNKNQWRSGNRSSSSSRSNRGFLAQLPTKDIIKTPAQRLAEAQAFAEQQRLREAQDNRINEYNPYGSATYETDANGNTARRINLSPEQQALYDQQMKLAQQGAQNFAQPMQDYNALRSQAEGRLNEAYTRDFQDRFSREREALSQELANKGIPINSELYNRQMQQFDERRNSAYLDARDRAYQGASSEAQNAFTMDQNIRNQPFQGAQNVGQFIRNPQYSGNYQMQNSGLVDPDTFTGGANDKYLEGRVTQDFKDAGLVNSGGGGRGRAPLQEIPVDDNFTMDVPDNRPGFGEQLLTNFVGGAVGGAGQYLGNYAGNYVSGGNSTQTQQLNLRSARGGAGYNNNLSRTRRVGF